jgi:predicted Zn-dependent peptidase
MAHLMEHLAFRRTDCRSSRQIANEFENLGAFANAHTSKEFTCYYVRALKTHFKKIFKVLADLVLNTKLLETDFEKERSIVIEEIKSYEYDPE